MTFRPLTLCLAVFALLPVLARAADKPNVLWIMSEDNSKHYLKLFDENGAPAPNIEKLAAHGLAFDRAFSNAPVCSVARTTLITSCYAPRIGTQFHRRAKSAEMPEGLRMFPAYLRDVGYYTTNNSKEDYNATKSKDVWDDSSRKASWRNRPDKNQPFFHVQTYTESHESSLHFPEELMKNEATKTDPASVKLAPIHPDTPTFRYTLARYHDRMGVIDDKVGELVTQLEEDGLLEDTFIFYFGDHGGVLPGSKGYTYERGLHIPLVVRVPEKWKHLVDAEIGSRVSGFVSFIDFGPTVLNLAGAKVPDQVDGKPFLGKGITLDEVNQRDETFSYADRMDERYEMVRTVRKGKYKYIRNYEGFYPDSLQNNYRYISLAWQDWRNQYQAGKLNAVQARFFEPKPAESLYDVEADPWETKNLAGDPDFADTLKTLRGSLQTWVKGMPDLSFYPESVLVEKAMDNPVAYGQAHADEISRLVDTADLALLPFDEASPKIVEALDSENPWVRYWALTDLCEFGEKAKAIAPGVRKSLADSEALNRVRAATFLALVGEEDPAPTFKEALANSDSEVETLIIMNMAVLLHDHGPKIDMKLTRADVKQSGGEVERRLWYLTGEGDPKGKKGKAKNPKKAKE
ncbi:MAG: sulfatase-like hydrolase/transferase [Verrucomicrobiae bacterium]|nr:sulfatase-like hydrolase/transferase [Verrucomicrobiae bacterium]